MFLDLLIQIALIFLGLINIIIFIDVILSWTILLGFSINLKFIRNIVDPIYNQIRKILPTSFGMIDFTPFIAGMAIYYLQMIIVSIFSR